MISTILLIHDSRFPIGNDDAWKLHASFLAVWEGAELRLRPPPKLSTDMVLQIASAIHDEAQRELRKARTRFDDAAQTCGSVEIAKTSSA